MTALPPGIASAVSECVPEREAYAIVVTFTDGTKAAAGSWPMLLQAQAALPHALRLLAARIKRETRKRRNSRIH